MRHYVSLYLRCWAKIMYMNFSSKLKLTIRWLFVIPGCRVSAISRLHLKDSIRFTPLFYIFLCYSSHLQQKQKNESEKSKKKKNKELKYVLLKYWFHPIENRSFTLYPKYRRTTYKYENRGRQNINKYERIKMVRKKRSIIIWNILSSSPQWEEKKNCQSRISFPILFILFHL